MPLWLASALLILFLFSIFLTAGRLRSTANKLPLKIIISLLTLTAAALLAYLLLTALFFSSIQAEEPEDGPEPSDILADILSEKPEEEPSLRLQPDIPGFEGLKFGKPPYFVSREALSAYVLGRLMLGRGSAECYVSPELMENEGRGSFIFAEACENAMSYYFFGAYEIYDLRCEDTGDSRGVHISMSLRYPEQDKDMEACRAAAAFVEAFPPPEQGFESYEGEKAYALLIHDYLINKLSYGARPEDGRYLSGQEAWSALSSDSSSALCAGYARGFALIARYAGIDCIWLRGNEDGSHAWNVIFPCDGSEPVIVDVTWDDTSFSGAQAQEPLRDYFYVPVSLSMEHNSLESMRSFVNYLRALLGDSRILNR